MTGAWRIAIAGLIALAAAIGIGRFAFTPLLPMMQHDNGLSITAGGWLASANYLGYFTGAISAVWLRLPALAMLRVAMVLNALLIAGMGVTESLTAWLVIRGAAGVASAWVFVFASTLVLQRLAQCGHIELSSVMFSGVGIGMLLPGLMCIVFVASGVDAQRAWGIFAVVAAVAVIMVWWLSGAGPPAVSAEHRDSRYRPHWTATMGRLIASYGLFGLGYIIPATFLPVIARDLLAGSHTYVWFWPVCGAAAALSVIVSVGWSRKYGDYSLLMVCCVAEAVGIALPLFAPQAAAIGVSAVLLGGTFVVITVAALREARRLAPGHAGSLIAAMTASFALGQIAGPVIAAYLVTWRGDFVWPLILAATALLIAGALLPKSTPERV
ncbi:MAG: YbfB/YjiJ family MFS transporter [Betaproteobacteria bacterium]|nr:YbfB/YjiJ family MFS transporter [Betaproteobacteria bacterium]